MSRGRQIALVVAGVAVGLALLAWSNRPSDDPARATVDDAVRSFRAENAAGGKGRPGGPPLGVYRYRTRGYESAQSPILDTTHEYDGVSTITLSEGRCGIVERWQVLAGRWAEGEACPAPDGARIMEVTEFHEFFGVGQKDSFSCRGLSMPSPAEAKAGTRFASSCESESSSVSNSSRIVGFEAVRAAGETIPAIRVESRSRFEGESSGRARREEWRRRSDGLLLRRTVSSSADTSRGAGTHYTERYTIELLDLEPHR